MFKPTYTLLLITRQILARVDMSAGKVRKTWVRPRFESESIATLVDATLRLGPRRSGKVWVLSCDFWTGVVTLPPDVTALIGGGELEQSVALEAESYSGVSAFDSRVGLRKLAADSGSDARYWVTQVGGSELNEIENAVRSFGSVWGGAAHPAVPLPPVLLTSGRERSAAWQIVQAWGETTLASRGQAATMEEMAAIGGRMESSGTRTEWARWLTAVPESNTIWISDKGVPPDLMGPDDSQLRVDQEAGLVQWAEAWTQSLADSANAAPLIKAAKRPMSQERQIFLAASLGLLAIGIGYAHNRMVQGHLGQADSAIEQLEGQKKSLVADKKSLADLVKRNQTALQSIVKSEAQRSVLERDLALAQQTIAAQRTRWVELIDALLEASDKNSWVQRIEGKSDEAEIHGMAITDAAANRFASDLESAARRVGWTVRPARTTLAPNSLTEFTINLRVTPPVADESPPTSGDDGLLSGTTPGDGVTKRGGGRAR